MKYTGIMSFNLNVLEKPANQAARTLLGYRIIRMIDGAVLSARIVETEAYDQTDAASHSYRGRTPRTDVMFGPAAHLYVYFTYGMHYCCNIVTGKEGEGSAVLIRAVEPLWDDMDGTSRRILSENRGQSAQGRNIPAGQYLSDTVKISALASLTNGPAKFCQAFDIDRKMNGHDLRQEPLVLELPRERVKPDEIVQTTRIGIREAREKPWRFYIRDNPYVSKP
jgi:DNA-3-methyladenine glycosylase